MVITSRDSSQNLSEERFSKKTQKRKKLINEIFTPSINDDMQNLGSPSMRKKEENGENGENGETKNETEEKKEEPKRIKDSFDSTEDDQEDTKTPHLYGAENIFGNMDSGYNLDSFVKPENKFDSYLTNETTNNPYSESEPTSGFYRNNQNGEVPQNIDNYDVKNLSDEDIYTSDGNNQNPNAPYGVDLNFNNPYDMDKNYGNKENNTFDDINSNSNSLSKILSDSDSSSESDDKETPIFSSDPSPRKKGPKINKNLFFSPNSSGTNYDQSFDEFISPVKTSSNPYGLDSILTLNSLSKKGDTEDDSLRWSEEDSKSKEIESVDDGDFEVEPEFLRENTDTLKKKREAMSNWNERFQNALSKIKENPTIESHLEMIVLSEDFTKCAINYGKIIISEVFLENEKKTIRPVNLGGGKNYLVHNILFKFALDKSIHFYFFILNF